MALRENSKKNGTKKLNCQNRDCKNDTNGKQYDKKWHKMAL